MTISNGPPTRLCRLRPVMMAIVAMTTWAAPGHPQDPLPYGAIADRIVTALQADSGEHAILRLSPTLMPQLADHIAARLGAFHVSVDHMPYGEVDHFFDRLWAADIYVWLPNDASTPWLQFRELWRWLDSGQGRQVHFHWKDGTAGPNMAFGEAHTPAFDSLYVDALRIDYDELSAQLEAAARLLRSGEVRITTPGGTDVRFLVGDRPINRQDGDASRERMRSARIRIDREIELPAGVLRVAPIEETVTGTVVIPVLQEIRDLRLEFRNGILRDNAARVGHEAFEAALTRQPSLRHFREFGLGMNRALVLPAEQEGLAYYGYGAGVVRISLGDNTELGGRVHGGGFLWMFLKDATVTVGSRTLVDGGVLQAIDTGSHE